MCEREQRQRVRQASHPSEPEQASHPATAGSRALDGPLEGTRGSHAPVKPLVLEGSLGCANVVGATRHRHTSTNSRAVRCCMLPPFRRSRPSQHSLSCAAHRRNVSQLPRRLSDHLAERASYGWGVRSHSAARVPTAYSTQASTRGAPLWRATREWVREVVRYSYTGCVRTCDTPAARLERARRRAFAHSASSHTA